MLTLVLTLTLMLILAWLLPLAAASTPTLLSRGEYLYTGCSSHALSITTRVNGVDTTKDLLYGGSRNPPGWCIQDSKLTDLSANKIAESYNANTATQYADGPAIRTHCNKLGLAGQTCIDAVSRLYVSKVGILFCLTPSTPPPSRPAPTPPTTTSPPAAAATGCAAGGTANADRGASRGTGRASRGHTRRPSRAGTG